MVDEDTFKARLLPGEIIAWSGRPADGLMFRPADLFLIPFSVFWVGFVVVWTVAAASAAGPFAAFGLLFVLAGLTMMGGRFWLDAWLRARTRYAVTDRRILISRPSPFGEFVAIALDRLADARLSEGKDGRGSIRFGQAPPLFAGTGFGTWAPALDPTPQFIAITDARRVFDLIQRST
jgi:hypothetical protein